MATRQREKAEKREQNRDKRPRAEARFVRISPLKVEIVLDLVRGKMYAEAVAILSNTRKSACEPILKVLNSAAANAENNSNMPKDELFVAECYSTSGPTLKRMMPRARGRADRIFKRTSHIVIVLDERGATGTKGATTKKEVVSMKKETKKPAPQKKSGTRPAEIPDTQSERPLTNKPNSKRPLGTKKETDTPGKSTRVATAKTKEKKN